jgi:cytochrome P450
MTTTPHVEVYNFVVAGSESTGRTLTFGVKTLSQHPEVQKKLREELVAAGLDVREMTFDDLVADKVPCKHRMKYYSCAISDAYELRSRGNYK